MRSCVVEWRHVACFLLPRDYRTHASIPPTLDPVPRSFLVACGSHQWLHRGMWLSLLVPPPVSQKHLAQLTCLFLPSPASPSRDITLDWLVFPRALSVSLDDFPSSEQTLRVEVQSWLWIVPTRSLNRTPSNPDCCVSVTLVNPAVPLTASFLHPIQTPHSQKTTSSSPHNFFPSVVNEPNIVNTPKACNSKYKNSWADITPSKSRRLANKNPKIRREKPLLSC